MSVLDWARSQIGKPYSGPIVGQPDSYRWGDPGWDCSSFVSGAYAANGVPGLPGFTDALASAVPQVDGDPQPGDLILYRYADPSQPGVRYPHVDLWLGNGQVIGARFPGGVNVYPLLNRPYEVHRVDGTTGPALLPALAGADGAHVLAWVGVGLATAWALDLI